MIRQVTLLLVFTNVCCVASANDFRTNFREGVELLQEGDAEKALEIFQNLLVEHPTNQDLQYALGCAHSALVEKFREQNRSEEASAHQDQAALYFEKAAGGNKNLLRQYAQYNKANVAAKEGLYAAKTGEYNRALEKMKAAVNDYERLLQRYPDYRDAAQNRDHISYQLKRLLQNPPPESPGGDKKDQNQENQSADNQENKTNDNQESRPSEQPNKNDDDSKNKEKSQKNKQPAPSQPEESSQHSSGQQSKDGTVSLPDLNNDVEGADIDQKRTQLKANKDQREHLNTESIQAILDSLEQRDQEEQRERREVRVREQPPEQWW